MNKSIIFLSTILFTQLNFGMELIHTKYFNPAPYTLEEVILDKYLYIATEHDKIIFKQALDNAPERIKEIIKDKQVFRTNIKGELNCLLLTGYTGLGKSVLAKAIAFELGGIFVDAPAGFLFRSHRNETVRLLQEIIKKSINELEKVVVVVDDIDLLLQHYDSEYHDSMMTTKVLCKILDEFAANPNFLLIGTAFEPNKISREMMNKFGDNIIELPRPNSLLRKEIIVMYLKNSRISVDVSVNGYVGDLVNKTEGFSQRKILQLMELADGVAFSKFFSKKSQDPILKIECFDGAFKRLEELLKEFI